MLSKYYKNGYFLIGFYLANSTFLHKLTHKLPIKRAAIPEKWINQDTKMCIDGFLRSGGTYFAYYFRYFNPGQHLAHHTHSLQQINKSHSRGIPLIITIRHPLDSLSSLVCYDNRLSIHVALHTYIYFYQGLLNLPPTIYFDLVEHKDTPWLLIQKINEHYGTSFAAPILSAQELAQFLATIPIEIPSPSILSSPIPNEEKRREKELIKKELLKYKNYKEAVKLYQALRARKMNV